MARLGKGCSDDGGLSGLRLGVGTESRSTDDSDSSSQWESDEEFKFDLEAEPADNFLTKIVTLHTAVWTKMLSSAGNSIELDLKDLSEFSVLLSELREFFLCSACEQLVSSDFTVTSIPAVACPSLHLVCKECEGQEWKKSCRHHAPLPVDLGEVRNNLAKIIESYKGFCLLWIQTRRYHNVIESKAESGSSFDAFKLISYLREGALKAPKPVKSEDASLPTSPSPIAAEKGRGTDKRRRAPEVVNEASIKVEPECFNFTSYDSQNGDEPVVEADEGNILFSATSDNKNSLQNHLDLRSGLNTSTQPRLIEYIHPHCIPNWPDTNQIVQYASGHLSLSATPTYFIPVSITQPLPTVSGISLPLTLPAAETGVVEKHGTTSKKATGTKSRTRLSSKKGTPAINPPSTPAPVKSSKRGCRCGNATNPGKHPCSGQRCLCYAGKKLCNDCSCKGCRNPYQADGKKVLPGTSQVLDTTRLNGATSYATVVSNSNTLTFQQAIPEASTFTPMYQPMSPVVTSYSSYPVPVQVPISLVEFSSLLQPSQDVNTYSINNV